MAVKLTFESSEKSDNYAELQCYVNIDNEISISIEPNQSYPTFITLDIPTAIKLQKELRKQIGLAKDFGGENDNN